MASESEHAPPAEDTVVLDADTAVTQVDGDWPVTDLSLVEPDEDTVTAPAQPEQSDTVVVTDAQSPAPARRWIPPDVGTGLMLAIAGIIGAFILVALLLGLRDDDAGTTARTPTTSSRPGPTSGESTIPAPTSEAIVVRDVEGMSLGRAERLLERDGLRVRVSRLESDRPRGEILIQRPPPATNVAEGDSITLVVSSGAATQAAPGALRVPGVVGLAASDAVAAIRDAGFEARVELVSSSQTAGSVLRQSPAAETEASKGDFVVLKVAKSRPTVQRVDVPDVVGTTAGAARRALRSAGLTVAVVGVQSQEPAGTVVSQSPRSGAEVRKGSVVTLNVSTGPTKLDVPDVTGLDEASARLELESAGFEVRVTDESTVDPAQDGLVVGQSPLGGSTAPDGSVVTLTVARLD
jgi:beta-lactam-binding protein with PASTA domain